MKATKINVEIFEVEHSTGTYRVCYFDPRTADAHEELWFAAKKLEETGDCENGPELSVYYDDFVQVDGGSNWPCDPIDVVKEHLLQLEFEAELERKRNER